MRPRKSILSTATLVSEGKALIYGVFRRDSTILTLVRYEACSKKGLRKFIEALEKASTIKNICLLQKDPGGCLILLEKELCEFYDYTLGSGIPILFPYIMRRGYRSFVIIIPSSSSYPLVRKELERHGQIVEMKRISLTEALRTIERHIVSCELRALLTPTQRRVIETAFKRGYYDWPRRVQLNALSQIIGISKATVSEHLRKSERKILSLILSSS